MTYGFDAGNDVVCTPRAHERSIANAATVAFAPERSYDIEIKSNPGRHNLLNATAALVVADVLGLDVAKAAEALSSFEGVRRRFTHVGDVDGVTVVDDYGHHPTEIRANARRCQDARVCAR